MSFKNALLSLVILTVGWATPHAAEPKPIPADQLDKIVKLIQPDAANPVEIGWLEIPWMTNTFEARKKAAAEDKPIVVWSMSACPLGGD